MKKVIAVIIASAILAGCTGTIARGKALTLQEQGFPPGFVTGYEDGCQAGAKAGGNMWSTFKKDVDRYTTDAHYQQGWNNGFSVCKQEYLNARNSVR